MADAPVAFISYSHDSPDHKQWVAELASRLRRDGIDVKLDQWDFSPGDDVTLFMENTLRDCQRVLCICTETYVLKANAGTGGVGYERMIVTAELVKDISTSKFIPVIRQSGGSAERPRFLETRFYVDLSNEEDFKEQYENLLRELHSVPPAEKPPVGRNPFARSPSGEETPAAKPTASQLVQISPEATDPSTTYQQAIRLARAGDLLGWRQLVKVVRKPALQALLSCRTKYDSQVPTEVEALRTAVDEAILGVAPLIVLGLAGVESGRDGLRDQRAIVDDVLHISGWPRSGPTILIDLPEAVVYAYQALHGAMAMTTGQFDLAIALADMKPIDRHDGRRIELFRRHDLVRAPTSFGGQVDNAWGYLTSASERWLWLPEVFGDDGEYRTALSAYYLLLNVHELAETLSREGVDALIQCDLTRHTIIPDVPLSFSVEKPEVRQRAVAMLLRNSAGLRVAWDSFSVDEETMRRAWPKWAEVCQRWLASRYRGQAHWVKLPHAELFDHL